ncbi:pseudouridine synthase [Portibacter lacus]|uniref:tRNA pseudouridine synthase C n=1 Tax=Portibacter lacus TaxID=1099794 RepID=A0AA37SRD5_9BACT|nr:pseudouridine synthase [Portibacter lacus]GLR16430.1 tRNA pseudouridine synthase C [Portibacter lacus]
MILEIVYEDEHIIAINKPHGLLVHRTKIANDATEFALQILRDQIGQKVFPAHRIDRKTSGVLLFSKSKLVDSEIQHLFRNHLPIKTYKAIVRGYAPSEGTIDYAIGEGDKKQDALTKFTLEKHFEINVPLGKHPTSRYSLISVMPTTGRFHQIRKHMSHIFHPIIGDRPHGCSKQNRFWKSEFQMETMMLHAEKLQIEYPKGNFINIKADPSPEFLRVLTILKSKL